MGEIRRNVLEEALQKHEEGLEKLRTMAMEKFDQDLLPRLEKGVHKLRQDPSVKFVETFSRDVASFISKQEGLTPIEGEGEQMNRFFLFYSYMLGGEEGVLFALSPDGWLGRGSNGLRLYPIRETVLDCLGYLDEKSRGEITSPSSWLKRSFRWVPLEYRSVVLTYRSPEKNYPFQIYYKNFRPNYGIGGPYGKPNVSISFHGLNTISAEGTTPKKLQEFVLDVAKTLKSDRPYLEEVKKRAENELLKQTQNRIPKDVPYPQIPIDLTSYALGQIGRELRALRGEKPESIT